jgi:protein tyrosine phosphatase (PTP) superfamily phosphohydrolase (DUF442 family)
MTPALSDIHKFYPVSELISTSGQPSELQIRKIAASDFTVIINLGLLGDPRYSLPDEKGFVTSLGLDYVHIPVQFSAPIESDLNEFFVAMQKHEGKKIWIHCAANIRVSAFLGLYHVIKKNWNRDLAFKQMLEIWQPDSTWTSFIESILLNHDLTHFE